MKPFNLSGEFPTSSDGLRGKAVRGAAVTLVSQAAGLSIQVIATIVLARLLTPADFGLVTMVTTFSLLLLNFGGNGFTEAIIQRQDLNHGLASNLFWINLAGGALLTLVFAGSGALLARFFHEPLVAHVAVGISLSIFVTSTSVIHLALLMKAMRFTWISCNDIVARVVSVTTSVLLAKSGWGYWALVGGAVAQPCSLAVGGWIFCRWVPGPPRRLAGTNSMLRLALHVYGRFSLNYFGRNIDNLLVGWRFNAQSLGFYKKAYDLFALSVVMQSLTNVAVSALSRLRQDSQQYQRYLLRALSLAAFAGMGLGAILTLVGQDIIALLLGPKWGEAGRIFVFFGPGIGAMFLYGTHGWVHLSIGRGDRWFRWSGIEFATTALLFVLALEWGPAGVAAAWSLSLWLLALPALWYAGQPIRLKIAPIAASVSKYAVAALISGFATHLIIQRFPDSFTASGITATLARVITISLLFIALYLGMVVLVHGGGSPIYQLVSLLREMIPWSQSPQPIAVGGGNVGVSVAVSEARASSASHPPQSSRL